jgi:hypothetical protein
MSFTTNRLVQFTGEVLLLFSASAWFGFLSIFAGRSHMNCTLYARRTLNCRESK